MLGRLFGRQKDNAQVKPLEADGVVNDKTVSPIRAKPQTPSFPRFYSTAGDTLDRSLKDRFASVRVNLRHAYTPAQPVTDRRMFAGRTELLTSLIRAVEDQHLHTVIYGERGIGKTSILHILTQVALEARYLVVYISCGASSNFDEMFRAVASEIPLLFHSQYGPTAKESESGQTMADLLPPTEISVRYASDVLAKIKGTRVIIVLDEFDRCESSEFRKSIAELVKNLSDRSVRAHLVIAGVAANLSELIEHIPSIRRNLMALEVPKMSAAEVRQLIKNGEDTSGLHFDDEALNYLSYVSLGLPYVASLLSHYAGLSAIGAERLTITGEDVSSAIKEALTELKGRMSKRSQLQIADLVKKGLYRILGTLAGTTQVSGGRFTLDEVDGLYAGPDATNRCKSLIEHLANDGVLIERYKDEGREHFRFREESVPSYLWLLVAQSQYTDREKRLVNTVQKDVESHA
jgi:Cdc6-like AAA superfamily ATPase